MARKPKPEHKTNRHHRKPRSIGGDNSHANISIVGVMQHRGWHTLFANHPATVICHIINAQWLDPAYKFICVPAEDEEEAMQYAKKLRKERGI